MAVEYIGSGNDGFIIDMAINQAKIDNSAFVPVTAILISGDKVRLTDATGKELLYKYAGKGSNKFVAFTGAQR